MRNIKLTIEYDGTNYCGWQRQRNGSSIQETLEKALKKILREKVNVVGAGRTDSGVHAQGQVANFKTTSRLTTREFFSALNATLPEDIVIKRVEEVGIDFNARFSAKNKLYRYYIFNSSISSPFQRQYSYQYRHPLNVAIMRKEAKLLLGKHDFKSFQAADKIKRTSVRRIKKISIKKHDKHIYIDIEADGFLYNMVRNIVGTLVYLGKGKLRRGDMKKILKAKKRSLAGPTAPPQGLCLIKVDY